MLLYDSGLWREGAGVGDRVEAVGPARREATARVVVGEVVRGDEGAGEEGNGIDIELAGREEDDSRAHDKTCDGELVDKFGLVSGGGGCRRKVGFWWCHGGYCEDIEGRR